MANRAHCMVVARDPSTGATLLAATINVYAPGTVTPIVATMFDKNGNVLSNPLTSDATTGLVDFYLNVAQEVDLVVAKAGYTTRTYSNVPVLDDAGYELTSLLTTTGDLPYASSANTPARLPIGGTGTFLTVSGGVPTWSNTIASGGLTITAGGLTVTAGGATVTAGGLTVTAGNVGIGTNPSSSLGLDMQGTLSSAGGSQADGIIVRPTLNANANSDTIIGLQVSATLSPNSHTSTPLYGVQISPTFQAAPANNAGENAGITVKPTYAVNNSNNYGVKIEAVSSGGGSGINYGLDIENPSGASGGNIGLRCAGTLQFTNLGAFASGDKYLIVDSSGNVHKSGLGPAS